jgi:hypothetical protein
MLLQSKGSAGGNGAHSNSFAVSPNGAHRARDRTDPPIKAAAPEPAKESGAAAQACDDTSYEQSNGAQPQSVNGSKACTIVKLAWPGKGQYVTKIPDAILRNKQLVGLPGWIICLALSMPRNWKLRSKWLCNEFDLPRKAVRAAMKRAAQAGYVKLKTVRKGQRFDRFWLVRASPELPWPGECKKGSSQGVVSEPFRKGHYKVDVDDSHQHKSVSDKGAEPGTKPTNQPSSFLFVGSHQNQQSLTTAQAPARVAPVARVTFVAAQPAHQAWGDRPIQDHPKFPEFAAWCRHQRDKHGRPGTPTEKGFWTWLARQAPQWRNKVKRDFEAEGCVLNGQFLTNDQATQLALHNPDLLDQGSFRKAIKRDGAIIIL